MTEHESSRTPEPAPIPTPAGAPQPWPKPGEVPAPPPGSVVTEAPASKRRIGLLAGAIAVAVALIGGLVLLTTRGDDAQAQPLSLRFEQGQSEAYTIHQTLDAQISAGALGDQALALDMTQTVGWEVTAVDADGVATIEVSVTDASGTINGTPLPETPDFPAIEIKIAADGAVVSAGGFALGGTGQTPGFGFPGISQLTPILPDGDQAVAPGDSWDKRFSQDLPVGEGTIELTAHGEYLRDETIDGVQAAVIQTDLTVPVDFTLDVADALSALGDDAAAGIGAGIDQLVDASIDYGGQGQLTSTSWVDLEAGELVQMNSSGDFDLSMGISGIPGLSDAIAFTGTFTQDLARA